MKAPHLRSLAVAALAASAAFLPFQGARGQRPASDSSTRRIVVKKAEAPSPRTASAPSTESPNPARDTSTARRHPDLTLYGLVNAGVDNYSTSAATSGDVYNSRQRIFDSGSRLGLRGGLDLGVKGLRAVFQIETGLNVDNGSNLGQGGQQNTSAGFLASRESFVGLEGSFGRVLVGRQNVYWLNGTIEQTAENYLSSGLPWLSGGGPSSSGKAAFGVALQSNVLSYTTPQMGAAHATFYYSPDAGGINGFINSENAQANAQSNARLLAASGEWARGAWRVRLDLAHKTGASDAGATGPAGFQDVPSNLGIKLGLGWKYQPGAQLSVVLTKATTSNFVADSRLDYSATTATVNWEQTYGKIQLLGQLGSAMKLSGCSGAVSANCDNTGAIGVLVGARYNFASDVAAYGFVSQVSNQANIFYDYFDYRYTSAVTSPVQRNFGADPRIIGIGMRFNFDAVLSSSANTRK